MISINISKFATFDRNRPPHPDNEIHVFTQFFIHPSSQQRNNELKYCLYRNYINPHIAHIHLLNEKIYTNNELGGVDGAGGNKITQTAIGKRLTFKDIIKYIRSNDIRGYCVFTNADIFFDSTIKKVCYSELSFKKQAFALLRYEFSWNGGGGGTGGGGSSNIISMGGIQVGSRSGSGAGGGNVAGIDDDIWLKNSPIFGPRYDSQDTWIFHFSGPVGVGEKATIASVQNNPHPHHTTSTACDTLMNAIPPLPPVFEKGTILGVNDKIFDIGFGVPGCDNKIAYILDILGYQLINDPGFIRTYHYHTSQQRSYTAKDVLPQPYSVIFPAGHNPYLMGSYLGIHPPNVIETTGGFQSIRYDDNDMIYTYISNKLERGEKFIIPRISGHENNYAFFGEIIRSNNAGGSGGTIPANIQAYIQQTIPIMKRNAGIRLSNIDSVIKYSTLYLRAFENSDIYGGWESWGHYMPHIAQSHDFIRQTYPQKRIFWAFAMDIFHYIYSRPFTTAMRGKRILIVSCFCDSIQAKLDVRKRIYDGVDLFPDCSFVFIRPPVTNGDNPSDEFDVELERFYRRLDELRGKYDVALLSCGGYANPIANYIYENHGASAIYVGGVLQMYFGIYGGRWLKERGDVMKLFLNEYWSRPLEKERPAGHSAIEGGCYW
jgi:hypothetical protein